MFNYKMPQEVKDKFTREFMHDFLIELTHIFHFMEPVFFSDDVFYAEGTCGWVEAFERTCLKHNMSDVFTYYEKLAWYDSDLFDDQLGKIFVEYELVEVDE